MKRLRKLIWPILILGVILTYIFLWVLDPVLVKIHNALSPGSEITTFKEFESIPFDELPASEKAKFSPTTCSSYNYSKASFLKISWFNRYSKISENANLYHLFTPDRLIKNRIRIPNLSKTQYLLLDTKVIDALNDLIAEMKVQKLNTNAITITSGFRNPTYNTLIDGAKCSQHQFGAAIDISVGDVNGDGKTNSTDRDLLYKILDQKVIGNKGGLGQYKNSPRLLHFDTRGHRARW